MYSTGGPVNRYTIWSLWDLHVVQDDAACPISLGRPGKLHFIGFGILIATGIGYRIGLYLYSTIGRSDPGSEEAESSPKVCVGQWCRQARVMAVPARSIAYLTAVVLLDRISDNC